MMRPSLERGVCTQYAQMWKGARWITRVWPLHPQAFGTDGLFVVISRAPLIADQDLPAGSLQFIRSSHFGELAVLTKRELETLYAIAHGLDVPDIAVKLKLSAHTVADYVKAIHLKLDVKSRGELVKKAVSLGITGFTEAEWEEVAVYVNQSRKP
jgi:DNA-binding CsgD family transcriptional regulator